MQKVTPGGRITLDAGVAKATLFTACGGTIDLPAAGASLGPLPADLCAGVHTLYVTTDCGCFSSPVYSMCPAPGFPDTFPSNVEPTIIECCHDRSSMPPAEICPDPPNDCPTHVPPVLSKPGAWEAGGPVILAFTHGFAPGEYLMYPSSGCIPLPFVSLDMAFPLKGVVRFAGHTNVMDGYEKVSIQDSCGRLLRASTPWLVGHYDAGSDTTTMDFPLFPEADFSSPCGIMYVTFVKT